jgi:hypothetical protein
MTRLFLATAIVLGSLGGASAQEPNMKLALALDMERSCKVGANNHECTVRAQTLAKLFIIAKEMCERGQKTLDPNVTIVAKDLCGDNLKNVERDFTAMVFSRSE